MKVCVYGLWHLGSVTSACLADHGFETIGLDPDAGNIANLSHGKPPLFEPGLPELVSSGIAKGRLRFTTDVKGAVSDAEVIWVAFDTPVDDDDRADVEYVKARIAETFPYLRDNAVVLISAQMPAGSVRLVEAEFAKVANGRTVHFACSPENLRLGKAIEIFTNPGRIIVGVRTPQARAILEPLLASFCNTIMWMSVESAEMTKHALNAFLATCVVFINEVATVCEQVGADAADVERAIRSDKRVGTSTYVTPGAAFAGGTLARDVTYLGEIAADTHVRIPMLEGIIPSNGFHRRWAIRRLDMELGGLKGKRIAIWGLSYKPGTDALRRSTSVEICTALGEAGADVVAFDPVVQSLPESLAKHVTLAASPLDAAKGADALVLATEWPVFRDATAADVIPAMKSPIILDQSRFLSATLGKGGGAKYITVGTGT